MHPVEYTPSVASKLKMSSALSLHRAIAFRFLAHPRFLAAAAFRWPQPSWHLAAR